MKKNFNTLLCFLAGSVLAACVTVNIYFPAAAAERAADKIIEEVWQIENDARGNKSNTKQPKPATENQP